jgi:DNA-binding Xre family transcriptional regulator
MRCRDIHCAINEELLALLPHLEGEQQVAILRTWASASLEQRAEVVATLRSARDDAPEADFATLAKLAAFLDCSVIDVVGYLRSRSKPASDDA